MGEHLSFNFYFGNFDVAQQIPELWGKYVIIQILDFLG